MRTGFSGAIIAVCILLGHSTRVRGCDTLPRPSSKDVLFIVVDDLNDWNELFDERAPIRTPNLARLAARGTLFTHAYCVSPACNPSRVATLTGLRPTSTGVYGNRSEWRRAVGDRKTIMQQFLSAGYDVRGAGKIFHHHLGGALHDASSFADFLPMRDQLYPPSKLNAAPEYGSRNTDWGAWPTDEKDAIDVRTANYCIDALMSRGSSTQPLFLACGIFKPHSPFFAPTVYHRDYANLLPPSRWQRDWDDLPTGAHALLKPKAWFWEGMQSLELQQPGSYAAFVRAYAACVSFADAQIGRVLDALDQSPNGKDTIVVIWSDHGCHLGEKDHIEKFALWEKTTRVPLIVVAPGVTEPGNRCDVPVDLSCLYPTLLELCGLATDSKCDGQSLVPLLRDPTADWERPAVMTYGRGNHAVRSRGWRYIRYRDGSEELYRHPSDRREWINRATDPALLDVLQEHRGWIPDEEAPAVGDARVR